MKLVEERDGRQNLGKRWQLQNLLYICSCGITSATLYRLFMSKGTCESRLASVEFLQPTCNWNSTEARRLSNVPLDMNSLYIVDEVMFQGEILKCQRVPVLVSAISLFERL